MLLPVQLPPPFGPPLLVLLLGPGHGQRVRGHILGDGGTRRDIGTRATVTGATRLVLQPMKAPSSMVQRYFFTPS